MEIDLSPSMKNKMLIEITVGPHELRDGTDEFSTTIPGDGHRETPGWYDEALLGRIATMPRLDITRWTFSAELCERAEALLNRNSDSGERFCACPVSWRRVTMINPFVVVVELFSGVEFCLASEGSIVMDYMVRFAYDARDNYPTSPTREKCSRVLIEEMQKTAQSGDTEGSVDA